MHDATHRATHPGSQRSMIHRGTTLCHVICHGRWWVSLLVALIVLWSLPSVADARSLDPANTSTDTPTNDTTTPAPAGSNHQSLSDQASDRATHHLHGRGFNLMGRADEGNCAHCHAWRQVIPNRRALKVPHNRLTMGHGSRGDNQGLWCLTCHDGQQPERLVNPFGSSQAEALATANGLSDILTHGAETQGAEVDEERPVGYAYDRSYRLCDLCHGSVVQDWLHGAHGGRTGSWRGTPTFKRCSTCHDPHAPAVRESHSNR